MIHKATPAFWAGYHSLPEQIQELADKAFALLKEDSHHPSLHFKKAGRFWSARVGLHHRTIGIVLPNGVLWFWIGSHADYDRLIG